MKQHILSWLSFSFILLFLISCKKKTKGVFDDFPPGKFNFEWNWNKNGADHLVTGEVSGPYPMGGGVYYFRRQLISGENEPAFEVRSNSGVINNFNLELSSLYKASVISSDISKNSLFLSFEGDDTFTGTFILTRK